MPLRTLTKMEWIMSDTDVESVAEDHFLLVDFDNNATFIYVGISALNAKLAEYESELFDMSFLEIYQIVPGKKFQVVKGGFKADADYPGD